MSKRPIRTEPPAPRSTLAAELALGVLEPDNRAAAEARATADPAFAAEAAEWSARLHPLTEEVAEIAPPGELWARIEAALPARPETAAPSSPSTSKVVELAPRTLMRRWRTLAAGASLLAAACLAAVVVLVGQRPGVVSGPLLAARLKPPAEAPLLTNEPLFTATLDRARASVVLTPVNPGPNDPRVRELWLIPEGGKPVSAGLIDNKRTVPLRLSKELVQLARAGATLAVTLEPAGGAPDGVPTGPIIAAGVLSRI